MFMRRPSYRQFEYLPRYYKPEDDEEQRRRWRMNVKFRSQRKRRGKRPVILYLAVLALVIYMYLALSGVIQ
jgi:hypothetical protein